MLEQGPQPFKPEKVKGGSHHLPAQSGGMNWQPSYGHLTQSHFPSAPPSASLPEYLKLLTTFH